MSSGVATEAAGADLTKAGDLTEDFVSPPMKKVKRRILRRGVWDDPEYTRQRERFEEQFEKSEGYDVDWDSFDFFFPAVSFEFGTRFDEHRSNDEFMERLIKAAIDEENKENGIDLKLVKYVSANVEAVRGFLFYITFWAEDCSSSNPEPKLYQAQVLKFADEIEVIDFRLRPTQYLHGL